MAVTLVLHAPDETAARQAARAGFDRIAELESVLSDYRTESEVRQLGRRAEREPGGWIPISADLRRVLVVAHNVAAASDGAFDPTIGPLVTLWRESRRSRRLPDPASRDSARGLVGWRMLEVDTIGNQVRLARPGMRLDLGGIAKGYILSEALATLRTFGATSALIEAGGDLALGAAPPGRRGWRIEIGGAPWEPLADVAVATSGTGEQWVEIGGVRYAHLVDPRTGLGLTAARQVTVIGPDPMTADALATAFSVLGPERSTALAEAFPTYRAIFGAVTDPGCDLRSAGCSAPSRPVW